MSIAFSIATSSDGSGAMVGVGLGASYTHVMIIAT